MHPSGRQTAIASPELGGQEAVVVEVGGGLRTYRAAGRDVLDGYTEAEMCAGGRGQPLLPWPNRLADGRYTWQGETYAVALSEPSTSTAIHGLTRWLAWEVVEAASDEVTVAHRLLPHPGYPWCLDAAISYRLDAGGLTVTTEVVNRSDDPAPFGIGFHPYLAVGGDLVDGCTLGVIAAVAYDADSRGLPVGTHEVAGTDDDFRRGRVIGDRRLDLTLTGLGRDRGGRCALRLDSPTGATELWVDGAYSHLQVFTGDTLAAVGRRRRGLAVEPMTGPANLLATGTSRTTLDPGRPWVGRWGLRPSAPVPRPPTAPPPEGTLSGRRASTTADG